MARCVLYGALEAACNRWDPRGIETKSWVDDVNQRKEGDFKMVRHTLVAARVCLGRLLEAEDLTLSKKTAAIATDWALAQAIARDLRIKGIQVQAKVTAPDLGIDRGLVRKERPKQAQGLPTFARFTMGIGAEASAIACSDGAEGGACGGVADSEGRVLVWRWLHTHSQTMHLMHYTVRILVLTSE